ncbi:MAG: SDR family oxidoreductase [Chloroflexi bacterium]|nr:SDR family oxidoreductase [Chloroflexota bacterium]
MAKFLVTGASGTLGRMVLQRLVERREEVRGLVRPGKLDLLAQEVRREVELVAGDYDDEASLQAALEGVDYVITAVRASLYDSPKQHYALEADGNRRLFRLAAAAGVSHLTFISLLHAEKFPEIHIFNAKHQAENILRESDLDYTILRPGALMSRAMLLRTLTGLSKGWFTPVEGENMPHSPLMYDDLAEFCVRAYALPEACKRTFNLGGPKVYHGSDWVRDLAANYGLPFKLRPRGSSFLANTMMRLVQPQSRYATAYIHLKTTQDFSVSPEEMAHTAALFGVKLRPMEEFYPPIPSS